MVARPRTAVTLVGAGTQGRRLAFMWSSQGREVHLVDPQKEQLSDSHAYIEQLRKRSDRGDQCFGAIRTHLPESLGEALQQSWLVVECVPERLPLKREMVAQLDEAAPSDTIIASNSSSYTISEIIEGLKLRNTARILSAHSYWPPETSAIEVMGHENTDPKIVDTMMDQCKEHGFTPFAVRGDSTGYIYNRIWAAIKREALLAASENVATPEEIDAIFKEVLKTPKGPFEQMDVVGLDVVLDIEEHYADKRKDIPTEPREYLKELIRDGKLGVKNGKGFYEYDMK